jgi:hypothetical protein
VLRGTLPTSRVIGRGTETGRDCASPSTPRTDSIRTGTRRLTLTFSPCTAGFQSAFSNIGRLLGRRRQVFPGINVCGTGGTLFENPTATQTRQPDPRKRTQRKQPTIHDVHRRLGSDVIAHLIADYEAGQPATALMDTYGLGEGTVLRLLREQGVEIRHQSLTPDQLAEAVRPLPTRLVTRQGRPSLRPEV